MGVGGGGYGGLETMETGVKVGLEMEGRLGVCWSGRGVRVGLEGVLLWVKVRLWVFRKAGWGGWLMLVLTVKEEKQMMGSGGLGLGGNVAAVVGEMCVEGKSDKREWKKTKEDNKVAGECRKFPKPHSLPVTPDGY